MKIENISDLRMGDVVRKARIRELEEEQPKKTKAKKNGR